MENLEFVQRCVKGDRSAWNEFVDRYSRLIYNYIYSVLKIAEASQVSHDYVNDLFQEIYVSLAKDNFKKLKSFKGKNGCSLASWLRQVVVNHTIDYLRKLKPEVSLEQEDDLDFSLEDILADKSIPVSESIVLDEMVEHLKECIEGLGAEDKYFLELHMNRGLGLEEMRGILRVSRGAVDMRKSRLIERLRECFRNKGLMLDL